MDENKQPFVIEIRLDEIGDVIIGTNSEEFNPYVVIAMLEVAKQKVMAQFMRSIMETRAQKQQLLVAPQQILVPR